MALRLLLEFAWIFGKIIVAVCWPLWALWLFSGSVQGIAGGAPGGVGKLLAMTAAWAGVLVLELAFLRWLLPEWAAAPGGELALAALGLVHMTLCTPWVAQDLFQG